MSDETDLIYLATNYSDPDPTVMERRFKNITRYASILILEGAAVYSPVTQSHPLREFGLIEDFEFWRNQDLTILRKSSSLVVYQQAPWQTSNGLVAEVADAREHDIPITFLDRIRCDTCDHSWDRRSEHTMECPDCGLIIQDIEYEGRLRRAFNDLRPCDYVQLIRPVGDLGTGTCGWVDQVEEKDCKFGGIRPTKVWVHVDSLQECSKDDLELIKKGN